MRRFILLALLLMALLPGTALAQTAVDITDQCVISAPTRDKLFRIHNGVNRSSFTTTNKKMAYIELQSPQPIHHLYIQWEGIAQPWVLQVWRGDAWVQEGVYGLDGFAQEVVAVAGETRLRIARFSEGKATLAVYELSAFTQGELPEWVHAWRKAERADLMVLVAHPDDEFIFLGGMLPTYAAERKLDVVVVYLTYARALRLEELLNGLWTAGVRLYPMIETRKDVRTLSLRNAYQHWDKEELRSYLVGLIRKYKPSVMVSHDVNGEYGHGAHRAAADIAMFAYDHSGDAAYIPELGEPFSLQKLYLHLYPENQQTFDWGVPLKAFQGQTALEVAKAAYLCHESQQGGEVKDAKNRLFRFVVREGGNYDSAVFGLYGSRVGKDTIGGDLFENIHP